MTTRSPFLAAGLLILASQISSAQVPADLRAAARARNLAVAKADVATWDKLTTDSFTVVFPSGPLTKAQRLAEIKLGKPTENPPLQNERFHRARRRRGACHERRADRSRVVPGGMDQRAG